MTLPADPDEALHLRHSRAWAAVLLVALLLFIALVPISHYLTPSQMNINLANERLWFLKSHFPGLWSYRVIFCAGMLALLLLGDALLALILKRPPIRTQSPAS